VKVSVALPLLAHTSRRCHIVAAAASRGYTRGMRVLVQRVSRASVSVEGSAVAAIGRGFLALVGVTHDDTAEIAGRLAAKLTRLRVFADEAGLMNLALADVGGAVLAVSQFTLYADVRRGNRPSFTGAAPPELGAAVYEAFVSALRAEGAPVETGVFGAHMQVELVNDGPVTILLEA
jgi:D-tyrosyl-tRNA(Tyr) deacylase